MPRLNDAPRTSGLLRDCAGALDARSDEQLVALLRQGRRDAFDALAARYETRLLWFCWKILKSKEDAEDALQDVFASAFRALVADDREILVRPWLYRIARNRCINELRRAGNLRAEALGEHHAELGHTLIDGLAIRQRFRELVRDVHALPDTQRTALLLRELDGFAYQEIAAAMNTTVPGVKSLLVRARLGLRDSSCARDGTAAGAGAPPAKRRNRRPEHRTARPGSYQTAYAAASSTR
jgi:RNA polymerase sigma factor (sigma-70 family)